MDQALRCWEHHQCPNSDCPARAADQPQCWLVEDTLCRPGLKPDFFQKMEACFQCDYFHLQMNPALMQQTCEHASLQFSQMREVIEAQHRQLEQHAEELTRGLSSALEGLRQISAGDPSVRVEAESSIPLISSLLQQVNAAGQDIAQMVQLSHEFAIGLAEHFDVLNRVASGDLSARVCGESPVELMASLGRVTNQMIDSIEREIRVRRVAQRQRRNVEEQLNQAQKMDAIGQLAGGVAHDFNNMLSVICALCDLVQLDLAPGHPAGADVEEIKKTGRRAAGLSAQLLAFSRRQVLKPEVIDLNKVTSEVSKMLRRLIDERIEFNPVLAPDLPRVKVDPVQIQQVLINLVVNARDAMPDGGVLSIETSAAELDQEYARSNLGVVAGIHTLLRVTDTGEGMVPEVMSHIFEPFFTTKDPGKGTGLGLATVYGIVQQSGGHLSVQSRPDKGTTVNVYLPAVPDDQTAGRAKHKTSEWPRGSETVLVVEDSEPLLRVAVRSLRRAGYEVLEASNGEQAMRLFEELGPGQIQLLFTDMVMPLMSGTELAAAIREQDPTMRVLFTSGYADSGLQPDDNFLQKPYRPAQLADVVHEVLTDLRE